MDSKSCDRSQDKRSELDGKDKQFVVVHWGGEIGKRYGHRKTYHNSSEGQQKIPLKRIILFRGTPQPQDLSCTFDVTTPKLDRRPNVLLWVVLSRDSPRIEKK